METKNIPCDFFNDLRVVELAGVLAGPAAGSFFAELGASVTKVENKRTGGDVTRKWQLPGESSDGPSAYYASANYGKEVHMLDFTDPVDLQRLHGLIREADIVLSNHRLRTAEKFQLAHQSLRKINPRLIHIQLNGYAHDDRPAYDVVLQAETGWISMNGTDPENPAKLPVALIDILAGHQIREAALLALIKRMKTGAGSYVEVTLEKSSLAALANQATNYLMTGQVAQPMGTLHPNIAPYGDWFYTSDRKRLVLAVGSESQFASLCAVLGHPEWSSDRRFESNFARLKNRIDLAKTLATAIGNFEGDALSDRLNTAGVPHGFIQNLDAVLESAAAREMLLHQKIDGHPTTRLSGLAYPTAFLNVSASDAATD